MRTKIIILFSLTLLPFLNAFASDWKVKGSGFEYRLSNPDFGNIELELESPAKPEILEIKDHNLFKVIVVDHGEVGTSCLVRIQKAYVFNKKGSKFIGVYPYKVISVGNKVKQCKVEPIVWKFFKNHISIFDKNTDKKFKLTP